MDEYIWLLFLMDSPCYSPLMFRTNVSTVAVTSTLMSIVTTNQTVCYSCVTESIYTTMHFSNDNVKVYICSTHKRY
jgi:hypothetical protein